MPAKIRTRITSKKKSQIAVGGNGGSGGAGGVNKDAQKANVDQDANGGDSNGGHGGNPNGGNACIDKYNSGLKA